MSLSYIQKVHGVIVGKTGGGTRGWVGRCGCIGGIDEKGGVGDEAAMRSVCVCSTVWIELL